MNLKVLSVHVTLLRVLEALLENPNLFVEPYVILSPSVLCFVATSIYAPYHHKFGGQKYLRGP
jgi:hypothetical protein